MIQNGLSRNISILVRPAVTIIVDIVIMFIMSWQLTLVALAGIALIAAWNNIFRRQQRELQRDI
jgi:ABC-type bacteriocin/lantibiotic exporter with double-glycine peptidase domain